MNTNLIERVPLIVAPGSKLGGARARGIWHAHIENPHYFRKSGNLKGWERWDERWENLIVNQGLDDLLSITLAAGTQDTTWFIGLISATPTVAAADTLASHAGWTEVTAYDEANRQAWTAGAVSGQAVSNSAAPAVFTINANGTGIGGAFLAGVNSGTSGRLYAAGAFSGGNVTLNDNATIDVTASFTQADDGV